MNLWFNQPKKLAKVSAVQPSMIIGLSRVPSFSTPRWPLLSKSMVWRNSEWVANQVASTLKPWPSTFRKTQYWSSRWTNNSTHREDNHEDLMVEIGMKKFRVLGVGWESGHVELLFSEWWERLLYICIVMYSTALNMPLSPLPHSQTPWSIAVWAAYQKLYQIYHTGSFYVDSGNVEAHCLQ